MFDVYSIKEEIRLIQSETNLSADRDKIWKILKPKIKSKIYEAKRSGTTNIDEFLNDFLNSYCIRSKSTKIGYELEKIICLVISKQYQILQPPNKKNHCIEVAGIKDNTLYCFQIKKGENWSNSSSEAWLNQSFANLTPESFNQKNVPIVCIEFIIEGDNFFDEKYIGNKRILRLGGKEACKFLTNGAENFYAKLLDISLTYDHVASKALLEDAKAFLKTEITTLGFVDNNNIDLIKLYNYAQNDKNIPKASTEQRGAFIKLPDGPFDLEEFVTFGKNQISEAIELNKQGIYCKKKSDGRVVENRPKSKNKIIRENFIFQNLINSKNGIIKDELSNPSL